MGYRLSKIYTRTGDGGTTGLGDGSRVAKDSARIEAIGCVDELNSLIGLLIAQGVPTNAGEILTRVQHRLFDLGGELAMPGQQLVSGDAAMELEQEMTRLMPICPTSRNSSSRVAVWQRQAATTPGVFADARNDVFCS